MAETYSWLTYYYYKVAFLTAVNLLLRIYKISFVSLFFPPLPPLLILRKH